MNSGLIVYGILSLAVINRYLFISAVRLLLFTFTVFTFDTALFMT